MRRQDQRVITDILRRLYAGRRDPHGISPQTVYAALKREAPNFDTRRLERISKVADVQSGAIAHLWHESRRKLQSGFVPRSVVKEVAQACGTSPELAKSEAKLWWRALSPRFARLFFWSAASVSAAVAILGAWGLAEPDRFVGVWKQLKTLAEQREPSAEVIAAAVNASLVQDGLNGTDIRKGAVTRLAPDTDQVQFTENVVVIDPRYVDIDAPGYFRTAPGFDFNRLKADGGLFEAESTRLLHGFGAIPEPPSDVLRVKLVKEIFPTGSRFSLSGTAVFVRKPQGWVPTGSPEIHFLGASPDGKRRAAFAERIFVAGNKADDDALKAMAEEEIAFEGKLAGAKIKYRDQLQAAAERKFAVLRDLTKPGSVFIGSATNDRNHTTTTLVLEVTDLLTSIGEMRALLRNDGGWSDARAFQGHWDIDNDATVENLRLSTLAPEAIPDAGPYLSERDPWNMALQLRPDGSMVGRAGGIAFTFNRVPDVDLPRIKRDLTANLNSALAAAAPGTVYRGTVLIKRGQTPVEVVLSFKTQEGNGSAITAVLQSADHSYWSRKFRGTIVENRYKSAGFPIQIRTTRDDGSPFVPNDSLFGRGAQFAVNLRVDRNRLSGEDNNLRFQLERVTPEKTAQFGSETAARARGIIGTLKIGAAFDGTIDDGHGHVIRSRLRIAAIDATQRTFAANLLYYDNSSIAVRLGGRYDDEDDILSLSGLDRNGRPLNLALHVSDLEIDGVIEGNGRSTVRLHNGAAIPSTGFPLRIGAYALVDGQWLPLPHNGVFLPGNLGGQVRNALGTMGFQLQRQAGGQRGPSSPGRPEMTFTGRESVPVVAEGGFTLAYVGDIALPPLALFSKDPRAKDQAQMAIEVMQTDPFGNRHAELKELAPGFSVLGGQAVGGMVEEVIPGVTLYTSTFPVRGGDYALLVGGRDAYELYVRR